LNAEYDLVQFVYFNSSFSKRRLQYCNHATRRRSSCSRWWGQRRSQSKEKLERQEMQAKRESHSIMYSDIEGLLYRKVLDLENY
jgi:hypothetical protein